jgi:hypothetical protein
MIGRFELTMGIVAQVEESFSYPDKPVNNNEAQKYSR